MMGALSQAGNPAGFAAFLANIGQAPAAESAEGGHAFGQMLAALPTASPGAAAPATSGVAESESAGNAPPMSAIDGSELIAALPAANGERPILLPDAVRAATTSGDGVPGETTPDMPAAPIARGSGPKSDSSERKPKTVPFDLPAPGDAAAQAAHLVAMLTGKSPKASTEDAPTTAQFETGGEAEVATAPVAPPPSSELAPTAKMAAAPDLPGVAAAAGKTAAHAGRSDRGQDLDPSSVPVPTPTDRGGGQPGAPSPAARPTIDLPVPKPATSDGGAAMSVLINQTVSSATAAAGAAPTAPVTEHTLDMQSDDQWIAQLAADIAATKSDKGDISFRLLPRHLGRLDVAMKLDGDAVSLKLDTQHEATATIVAAAQPRLVEDLRQQGVRVAGAEVTCTPEQANRQQQGQGQQQGRGAASDASHLIETANERAEPRDNERAADRRGRFA